MDGSPFDDTGLLIRKWIIKDTANTFMEDINASLMELKN